MVRIGYLTMNLLFQVHKNVFKYMDFIVILQIYIN